MCLLLLNGKEVKRQVGWNFGLAAGGFGGLFIATLVVVVMYAGLCYSIAEMSPALPHTGGAYSFARSSMAAALSAWKAASGIR